MCCDAGSLTIQQIGAIEWLTRSLLHSPEKKPETYSPFARYEARKCIKELWRSEGLKLSDWSMYGLRIASEQYLSEHWAELKPKAEQIRAEVVLKSRGLK